ncbi:hypothetical protein K933_03440 [Candidatus Halobonum tyrrellensis G22]|uniref:Uncharacterized protein n=1 Tax=Candidatus Halobonum tyrrellensis G22 TaxID=1324957 RepID=V4HIH6_9EURY|nr:hypothetical protein K933_03440 [Candidatus Halobonum tyrrellensis G22]
MRAVLLEADRLTVTAALSAAIFSFLLVAGVLWPFEMQDLLTETRAVQTLFNTLLSGTILLVSIVVSINSIVISQELGPLRSQYDRIDDTLAFQSEVEEFAAAGVSPAEPVEFLEFIIRSLREDATALRESAADDPADLREALETYADDVLDRLDVVSTTLDRSNARIPRALLAGLEYQYARHIHGARHVRAAFDDRLSGAERDRLDDVVETLKFFAAGREYFKTLYFKQELASLSSWLLYVSLPSIVFTSYVLLAIDAGLLPTTTVFGVSRHLLYVSIAYTVALAPFVLLTSFVLRIAAVSKRSVAAGAFALRDDPLGGDRLPVSAEVEAAGRSDPESDADR